MKKPKKYTLPPEASPLNTQWRAIVVFGLFGLFVCGLMFRLMQIPLQADFSAAPSGRRITAAHIRAPIYDTNGEQLVNIQTKYAAAAIASTQNLEALRDKVTAENAALLEQAFAKGFPAVVTLDAPIKEDKGLLVAAFRERQSNLAHHILGYTNIDGAGAAGLELAYNNFLSNHGGYLTAVFPANARGQSLDGIAPYWDVKNPDGGLKLTIDSEIQSIAENALDEGGVERGAAVIIDVATGAVRAMVSRPNFDPLNVAAALDSTDAPLINRAIAPLPLGSVFKPTVAAAALEAGVSKELSYNCKGAITVGSAGARVRIRCWNSGGHGWQNLTEAMRNSCNPYFINLAQKIPPELLLDMSRAMGYSQSTLLAPGITSSAGQLPSESNLNQLPAALGNFAIGQGDFSATPLQMAAAYAIFASGGQYKPPYIVEGFVDADGALYNETQRGGPYEVMRSETAEALREILHSSLSNNALSELVTGGGKTGTAQTARFDQAGKEYYYVWFAGFFPADAPKYAVSIYKEEGRSGGTDCAPIFKVISEQISVR